MKKSLALTLGQVQDTANLANLNLTDEQIKKFHPQISSVLSYMSRIQTLDTGKIKETTQVTNLTNVTREDIVDARRMLSQEKALQNAPRTHAGYFVVDRVLEE